MNGVTGDGQPPMPAAEPAAGPGPGSTALARLRWARELIAGVTVAERAGLLRGAGVDASEIVQAVDALSLQVQSWRAWVKTEWIRARARERVLGEADDPAIRVARDERLRALGEASQRLTAASVRLCAALTAAGERAARAIPPCTADRLAVADLHDPADGSATP